MYSEPMNGLAAESRSRRHTLADWLVLHELDQATCSDILKAIAEIPSAPLIDTGSVDRAIDLDADWSRTLEAMRDFLPRQRDIIDDTFERTAKTVVERSGKSRKALTLDNGPEHYPTIVYTYRGEPADSLVIAHEFAHALQIRASRGAFVPPILRETCAFLGERALLSRALRTNATDSMGLGHAWRKANLRHFGVQRDRLQGALLKPDAPYDYSWNYPVARYIAIRISERYSADLAWSIFEGRSSVADVLRELGFPLI